MRGTTGRKRLKERAGPRRGLALLCLSLSLAGGLALACAPQGKAGAQGPALCLDSGFEALFPELSEGLRRRLGPSLPLPQAAARSPGVLVASPYAAMQLLGLGSKPQAPVGGIVVVPFASGSLAALPQVRPLGYDYDAAYAAMGRVAAKALTRASSRAGRPLACAIVFQASFLRPSSALEAFRAAYTAGLGSAAAAGRLKTEEIPPDPQAVDQGGAAAAALARAASEDVGLVVAALDGRVQVEKAALDRSKIWYADASGWDERGAETGRFAYRLGGDEARLLAAVKAAVSEAARLPSGAPAGKRILVPLRVSVPFPGTP